MGGDAREDWQKRPAEVSLDAVWAVEEERQRKRAARLLWWRQNGLLVAGVVIGLPLVAWAYFGHDDGRADAGFRDAALPATNSPEPGFERPATQNAVSDEALEHSRGSAAGREDSLVRRVAQEAVRERLDYPRDAEFEYGSKISNLGGDRYAVEGLVKAKNAFGAMHTYSYRAELAWQRDGSCRFTTRIDR
jgi:hypothetical protein